MSEPIQKEHVVAELRQIKESTQAIERRIDALIVEVSGEPQIDPKVAERVRQVLAELRQRKVAKAKK
jgi:hypothetical protein